MYLPSLPNYYHIWVRWCVLADTTWTQVDQVDF